MPAQEVHEAFVIGIRHVEQPHQLSIAALSALEAAANHTFDMTSRNLAVRVGPRDGFPEVFDMDQLWRFLDMTLTGKGQVVRFDRVARRDAKRAFDNVLQ